MPPKRKSLNTLMERSIPMIPTCTNHLSHVPTKKRSSSSYDESQVRSQQVQESIQQCSFPNRKGDQGGRQVHDIHLTTNSLLRSQVREDNFKEGVQERSQLGNVSSRNPVQNVSSRRGSFMGGHQDGCLQQNVTSKRGSLVSSQAHLNHRQKPHMDNFEDGHLGRNIGQNVSSKRGPLVRTQAHTEHGREVHMDNLNEFQEGTRIGHQDRRTRQNLSSTNEPLVRTQARMRYGQEAHVDNIDEGCQGRSKGQNVSSRSRPLRRTQGRMEDRQEAQMDNFDSEVQEVSQNGHRGRIMGQNVSSKSGSLVRTEPHMRDEQDTYIGFQGWSKVQNASYRHRPLGRTQGIMEDIQEAQMDNYDEELQEVDLIDRLPLRGGHEIRNIAHNVSSRSERLMRTQVQMEDRQEAHMDNFDEGSFDMEPRQEANIDDFEEEVQDRNETVVQAHMEPRQDDVGIDAPKRSRRRIRLASLAPRKGEHHRCIVKHVPVGPSRHLLSFYLGVMARDSHYFPLNKRWGVKHEQGLEKVMAEIHDDFRFYNPDMTQLLCFEKVNHFCKVTIIQQLRDWRHELKKYFVPGLPISEQLQESPDEGVTKDEWAQLLLYWSQPSTMDIAARNTNNRNSGTKTTHTTGPISFAEIEYRAELDNEDSSLLSLYLKCHQKKNGEYPNDHTKEFCEQLEKRSKERGVEKTKDPLQFIPILDETFGPHHGGFERGFGGGVTRRTLRQQPLLNASDKVASDRIRLQLQKKDQDMEQLCAEKDREIEELRAKKDREIAELRAQLCIIESQGVRASTSNSNVEHRLPACTLGSTPRNLQRARYYPASTGIGRPPTHI